jgi:hypothetical protein
LNSWGNPERFFPITDAAQRRAQAEDIVAEIADAIATVGEYVTRVELQPTQRIVDFHWAAHQAGRRLGVRVEVDVRISNTTLDGSVEARVTRCPTLS